MDAKLSVVALSWQEGANIVVGQSHFIKTAEDIAEIMAGAGPGAKYGLAFCEASEPCLIRTEGNDPALVADAVRCAKDVSAGHTFYLVLKNIFPISILNPLKACPEVCRIYCATGNPLQIVVAGTDQGRGIVGVIDGSSPKGVEGEADKANRRAMLRRFGYKF
jgi:adenosine/AMP kinase